MNKNKSGENFGFGIFVALFFTAVFSFAFISEDNKITGFAVSNTRNADSENSIRYNELKQFKDVKSMETLAAGNYYIDENGIVYWIDGDSRPAVAKVSLVYESQKNKQVYIDNQGRIGYVLNTIAISP